MTTYTEHITMQIDQRRDIVNITPRIQAAVEKSGITDGLVMISSLHSNAAVFIHDDDPGLLRDIDAWLQKLAPVRDDYHYGPGRESNAGIHLQGLLLPGQTMVAVTGGKLELGAWRQIFFAELDGGRPKRVVAKIIGA
jgi:secondary thiamine-phosphate synthase enzyme